MRRSITSAIAAIAMLTVASPASALGEFDIKPVSIVIAPGVTSATVEVTNSGTTAQELEISVRSWTKSDGSDDGDATDDIIASPSIFIVTPGQTQLIRLGPSRDLTSDIERTYRLVATEVPDAASHAQVQTILRLRLPIFIIPRKADSQPLALFVRRQDAATIAVVARNDGNVHHRIRTLRVTAGGRVVFDTVVAAYVLAHQSRDWTIPLRSGDRQRTIDVRTIDVNGATREASFSLR